MCCVSKIEKVHYNNISNTIIDYIPLSISFALFDVISFLLAGCVWLWPAIDINDTYSL